MNEHSGRAELLDEHGNVVDEVPVTLAMGAGVSEDLWSGDIQPNDSGVSWSTVTDLRLDNGKKGRVTIEEKRIPSAETNAMRSGVIRGFGPPPF